MQNKNIPSKTYDDVACGDCAKTWKKRRDSLKTWRGFCHSCASKRLAALPHIKEIRRQNGIKVMARVGKLPHYPHNYRSGPANNKWRGGITPLVAKIRQSPEMKAWRKAVMSRDDFTCVICRKRGGNLHADHIQPFALYPELRFNINNGRTLCVPCHRQFGACVSHGKITRPSDGSNWIVG